MDISNVPQITYVKGGLKIRSSQNGEYSDYIFLLEPLLFNFYAYEIIKTAINSQIRGIDFSYQSYVLAKGKFIVSSITVLSDLTILEKDNDKVTLRFGKNVFLKALLDGFRSESKKWVDDYVNRLYQTDCFFEEEFSYHIKQCENMEDWIVELCNMLDLLLMQEGNIKQD